MVNDIIIPAAFTNLAKLCIKKTSSINLPIFRSWEGTKHLLTISECDYLIENSNATNEQLCNSGMCNSSNVGLVNIHFNGNAEYLGLLIQFHTKCNALKAKMKS